MEDRRLYQVTLFHRLLILILICMDLVHVFLNRLKENGYKNVLLDKDNAVTITHKMEIPDSILLKLNEGKNTFGFEHFMIFSNSIGSKQEDRGYKKANIFEKMWNIKVAHHNSKKPSGYDEIIQKDDFNKSIMIGDSLTTDIYGGNENGLLTVLVLPLSKSNKSFYKSCKLTKCDLFSCYGVMGIIYYYLMYYILLYLYIYIYNVK